jgi:two-component system chemotaxis sensor kinase CheA
MIMEINPLVNQTIKLLNQDGAIVKKVISASFYRIFSDENDKVEDVMVIFEDKTKIVKAEKELLESRNKNESEVELVAGILKIDPETLREFVEQSDGILHQVESWKPELSDPEILNKTFREIHSIKGLARTLGFRNIEKTSHSLEEVLVDIRDKRKKITAKTQQVVEERIALIFAEFDKIKDLNLKFKNFINTSIETRSSDRNEYKKLNSFFDTLREMTTDLAKKFDKEIILNIENSILDLPLVDKLKSSIIHLVTNSIDHGIEDNFERLSKSKPVEGKIVLKLDKLNEKYTIEVADDGRGIDFKKIREKAIQKKLIMNDVETLNNSDAIKLMFMPGFSSKDRASEVSGRGVGLDVVKDKLKEIQGKIFVTTRKDLGTTFKIEVPVHK